MNENSIGYVRNFLADITHLVAFSNVQFLSARFTDSNEPIAPGSPQTFVGRTPAFAPTILWKGGLTISKDKCFDVSLTAVYASDQYWQDSDLASSTTPAKIEAYKVFDLSGDWHINKYCRLIAGISNLANEKYYSRVFLNGLIQPAPQRSGDAGLSLEF